MELLAKLALFGLIAAGIWYALQPKCAFVIRLSGGAAKATYGVVTPAMLEQVRETCEQHKLDRAVVRGLMKKQHISLSFSRNVPPEAQQQLRNWWVMHAWRR